MALYFLAGARFAAGHQPCTASGTPVAGTGLAALRWAVPATGVLPGMITGRRACSLQRIYAAGHPSVVAGPDGRPMLFLHAYFPEKAGYKQFRALLALPLQFDAEGVRPGEPV